eukprot:TRINITY_DN3484_c0_g1_i4.p5 TRINITY_DN3484_c0_g1~~TRINITY_DN3484_c0_g1_i4.p5  ORF type:complete len:119 (-),score=16.62 TRINITY_DN3484_c0_g1_i4:1125-1481(-)
MQRSRVKSGAPEWYFVDDNPPPRESWFSKNRFLCRACLFLAILALVIIFLYGKQAVSTETHFWSADNSQQLTVPDQTIVPQNQSQGQQQQNGTEGQKKLDFPEEDVAGPVVPTSNQQQ